MNFFDEALPTRWRRLYLGHRTNWANLERDMPPKASVTRWRAEAGTNKRMPAVAGESGDAPVSKGDAAAMQMPKKCLRVQATPANEAAPSRCPSRFKRIEPIKAVSAVSFALKLRQVSEFSDALDDAHFYNWDPDEPAPERDRTQDPGRSTIDRSAAKCDVVGMLLERRIFAEEVASDSIESIHCFSDGSPVVGAELQGMVTEIIHRDGSRRNITMPGSTLFFGHGDSINKCMAFLWAIWLVCGPLESMMRVFLGNVRSFTTDDGVEMGIVLTPDVLCAFMSWIDGRDLEACRTLVSFGRRLFPRCLRIAGFNHLCAGLMKAVAAVAPTWPDLLAKLQCLCTCFRNETYRAYLVKAIGGRLPGAKQLLAHFTATTAKWRFATIVEVMVQLLRLRQVCEQFVREELFDNAQDKAFIQSVVNACRDVWLCKFIATTLGTVFLPLEYLRRWGLLCECHSAWRKENPGTNAIVPGTAAAYEGPGQKCRNKLPSSRTERNNEAPGHRGIPDIV